MPLALFHVYDYCTIWRFDKQYISKTEFKPKLCQTNPLDYFSKYNMFQIKVERLIWGLNETQKYKSKERSV